MSDSIAAHSPGDLPATLDSSLIGCICTTDCVLDAAVAKLLAAGITRERVHVGALDARRAQAAAERLSIAGDVSSDDPLSAFVGAGGDAAARSAMDRGGVIGGLIGAAAGCAIGLTPAAAIVAGAQALPVLANTALYFALGAITGSVLGAALAPQPSTHAGFRLIDGMQEGAYALIALAPVDRHGELRQSLEEAGAAGITSV